MKPRIQLVTLACLAALAGGCAEEKPPAAPALRPVRSETVAASGAAVERTFAGVARSGVESRLSFRVGGTVEQVAVRVGDTVSRGQVLARLDPIDYELRVEEAEAALAQGEAGRRKAVADYERVRGLYENNNVSKSDLDAARASSDSALALVEAGRMQLAQARQQVGYTRLRAPIGGAIAGVNVEVNENVQGGQAIVLLTSGARPEVEVAVPEGMIADIREGSPVEVTFNALPGRVVAATVTEVGVVASRTATTFGITARLDEPVDEVRSGMAAEVTFRFEHVRQGRRILVPAVSVVEDREGRFVFVLEPLREGVGVVRRRPVSVGDLSGERLEILDGLEEGEALVTAGVRRLSDGAEVRLLDAVEAGA